MQYLHVSSDPIFFYLVLERPQGCPSIFVAFLLFAMRIGRPLFFLSINIKGIAKQSFFNTQYPAKNKRSFHFLSAYESNGLPG
jgi:hypothetical protein